MLTKMLVVLAAVGMTADEIRQEVICAETGFSRAAEAKDPEVFAAYIDPDARFITGRVSRGRTAVLDAWSALLSETGPSIRWRPQYTEVLEGGHLAFSRGPYRTRTVGDDGEISENWGHFISTWRRNSEGRWLVVFDSGGDAGMTPTSEEVAILESEPDCP